MWARTDRPARMLVEVATTDGLPTSATRCSSMRLPETDFTAKAILEDLPAGQDIFYRIRFQDLSFPTIVGEPMVGRFSTAPRDRRSVSFVWSGDTAGQGWGIDASRGGMRTYATMLRNRPDFFVHCGDSIYADCPIPETLALPNGAVWRNIVTEDKCKVAETLAEYRGNYKYNLLDQNLRAFNAQVPIFAQWDDHEVADDWWPGQPLRRDGYRAEHADARGARTPRVPRVHADAANPSAEAGRVYRKIPYGPLLDVFMLDMRSYRGPNGARWRGDPQPELLRPAQLAWLKRALEPSRATWKVIAADLPIGLVSYDGIAQGDGRRCGRELEIADLLRFIQHAGVATSCGSPPTCTTRPPTTTTRTRRVPGFLAVLGIRLRPDPCRHLGTRPRSTTPSGPRRLSDACAEQGENLAPCFGLQFFGHVAIDGATAGDDGDAQGRRRPRAVEYRAGVGRNSLTRSFPRRRRSSS